MGQSYFIWKNKDCRAMGVKLSGPVPIIRPEERVNHVTIPGRSGDLTETEGAEVYNSYIQTATILVKGGSRVRDVYAWLRGNGYITFSGEPDRRQRARIIGAITLNKHSYNMDWWTGEVQFYCQPLKELLAEETVDVTTSGTALWNRGDVIARPYIVATASATSMTIICGGKQLTITGLTSGTKYTIDSDIMEVGLAEGVGSLTRNSSGECPVLNPGANTVTGSGWSKLVINRRERFL
jgi:phage-related protein